MLKNKVVGSRFSQGRKRKSLGPDSQNLRLNPAMTGAKYKLKEREPHCLVFGSLEQMHFLGLLQVIPQVLTQCQGLVERTH